MAGRTARCGFPTEATSQIDPSPRHLQTFRRISTGRLWPRSNRSTLRPTHHCPPHSPARSFARSHRNLQAVGEADLRSRKGAPRLEAVPRCVSLPASRYERCHVPGLRPELRPEANQSTNALDSTARAHHPTSFTDRKPRRSYTTAPVSGGGGGGEGGWQRLRRSRRLASCRACGRRSISE